MRTKTVQIYNFFIINQKFFNSIFYFTNYYFFYLCKLIIIMPHKICWANALY